MRVEVSVCLSGKSQQILRGCMYTRFGKKGKKNHHKNVKTYL
jgi:hypothetical protein